MSNVSLSIEPWNANGTWYSRSADFLQSPVMQSLRWMRVPGDLLFALGAALLGSFVFGLLTGHSYQKPSKWTESSLPDEKETHEFAAVAGD